MFSEHEVVLSQDVGLYIRGGRYAGSYKNFCYLIQNKEIRYMLSSIQEFIIDANESTEEIGKVRRNFYWPTIASIREITDYESLNFKSKKTFRNPQFIWWTRFITAVRKEGLEEEYELYMQGLNNVTEKYEEESKDFIQKYNNITKFVFNIY